jgi:protein-disulfide isomerase
MTPSHAAAAFTLACALAAPPAEAPPAAHEPAAHESHEPAAAVDLTGLSGEQRELLAAWAKTAFCYCGCPHTVEQCLREHKTCKHAARMMTFAARLLRAGAKKDELARLVTSYYASFDKRVKIEVAQFGPPLGDPGAKVTIVEWSDFTCPYCQMVRPVLESFVEARKERVKLVYKPFPIESHPGALELAQAGEWARDEKLFWPMHDALFANASRHSPDELADLASEVGGDPESLKAALASERYVPKIRASQAEARDVAGIKGTPSLFLNGRALVVGDYSDEGLELTLQDEEEWAAHGGWQRD